MNLRVNREELLEKYKEPIKVLNDGHIRLVDVMGEDSSIVQAARVSYGKGTKTVSDDRNLIRYLVRMQHTTPLEMCVVKLHVRVPMDCWRQWIRHRMSSVNEYSTRYSEAIDARQETNSSDWRAQSKTNKQGSEGTVSWPEEFETIGSMPLDPGKYLSDKELDLHKHTQDVYEERLRFGVAREQARKDLPLSTYTEAYWKIDLHNLFHFLGLRLDNHAQQEIREYSQAIAQIVKDWVPMAWEAFEDYRLEGVKFSKEERRLLGIFLKNVAWNEQLEFCNSLLGKRETNEFIEKIKAMEKLNDSF